MRRGIDRVSRLKQDLYIRNVNPDKYNIQNLWHEDVDEINDLQAGSDDEMFPKDIEINEEHKQSVHIEDSDDKEESNNARNDYLGSTDAIVDTPFPFQHWCEL